MEVVFFHYCALEVVFFVLGLYVLFVLNGIPSGSTKIMNYDVVAHFSIFKVIQYLMAEHLNLGIKTPT